MLRLCSSALRYRQLIGPGCVLACLPFIASHTLRQALQDDLSRQTMEKTDCNAPTGNVRPPYFAVIERGDTYAQFLALYLRNFSNGRFNGTVVTCFFNNISVGKCPTDTANRQNLDIVGFDRLASQTGDYQWYLNAAWAHVICGDFVSAVCECRRAKSLSHGDPLAALSLGLMLEDAGDSSGAMRAYADGITADPRALRSQFFADLNLRKPLLAQKAVASAEENLATAADDGSNAVPAAKLGRLLLFEHRYAEAGRLLSRALYVLPNLGGAYLSIAEYYIALGRPDRGIASLKKGLYLDPSDPLIPWILATELATEGQFTSAVEYGKITRFLLLHLQTEHSRQVSHLYATGVVIMNDALPQTLLSYTGDIPRIGEVNTAIQAWEAK